MSERRILSDAAALDALLDASKDAPVKPGLIFKDAVYVNQDPTEGVLIRLPWLDAPESTGKSIVAVRGKLPEGFTMPWRGRQLPFYSSILSLYTPIRGAKG